MQKQQFNEEIPKKGLFLNSIKFSINEDPPRYFKLNDKQNQKWYQELNV